MTLPPNDPRSAMPTAEHRMATPAPIRRRALLAGLGATGVTAAGAAISAPTAAAAPRRGAWPAWFDVTRYGVRGDGEADDTAAYAHMLDLIGSDHGTLYFPSGRYAVRNDLAFPHRVALVLDHGAVLEPAMDVKVSLSGPLQAGPYQVFGGDGRVVGKLGSRVALPQWWGAMADGENDDVDAINAAISALHEAGGGTVHLAAGVYLLGTVTIGDPPRFSTLIVPKSHVNIEGDGDVTVLKAANGLSGTGQWNFIIPPKRDPNHALTDVVYRNFKLDGNGENNLSDLDNPRWNNIGAEYGARITIDNLTFTNNASRQCMKFGFNREQFAVTDVTIRNCRFDTLAAAVPGNERQNDHSAINLRVDRGLIDNNTFIQPYVKHANAASAIEVHSSNTIVSNNRIINFHRAINAAAASHDHINVAYVNNVITDCRLHAFRFHCQNDKTMDRVRISGNTIVQASPLEGEATVDRRAIPMVRMNVRQPINSLIIEGNTFSYVGDLDVPHEDNLGRAIHFGPCHYLAIKNNYISGTLGSAIGKVGNVVDDRQRIEIIDNHIEDCCRAPSGNDGSDVAISLGHEAAADEPQLLLVRIEGNSIVSTIKDDSTMTNGIYGSSGLAAGTVVANAMYGLSTDLSWNSEVTVNRLHVEHVGPGTPEGVVRASVGSHYIDHETGETWDKVSGDSSASGWIARTRG